MSWIRPRTIILEWALFLGLMVLVAALVMMGDPEHAKPPRTERPDSGRSLGTPTTFPMWSAMDPTGTEELVQVVIYQAAAELETERQIYDRLAAEAYQAAIDAALAARPTVAPRVAGPGGTAPPTRASGPYADAAECTRAHEGWYTTNTGNGYYGAYQFVLGTWNATVSRMGRGDLVGVLPSDAAPADQDAAFWFLWNGGAGAGNWGGRCREYA